MEIYNLLIMPPDGFLELESSYISTLRIIYSGSHKTSTAVGLFSVALHGKNIDESEI
jgi:hypothetical protein